MNIRDQSPVHHDGVRQLHLEAFGTPGEADLVDTLNASDAVLLSRVALRGDEVVGHILVSPVMLGETPAEGAALVAIGPMSVRPRWQRQGIGTALIEDALQLCADAGHGAVFVLGHPDYYPRFGFLPTVNYDVHCEYPVPREAFMVRELQPGCLDGQGRTVHYHPAFNAL